MVYNGNLNIGDKVIKENISERDKKRGLSEGTVVSIDRDIATVKLRFPWQDNPQNIEQPSKSSIYEEHVNNLKVIDEFQYLVLHISMNGRVRTIQTMAFAVEKLKDKNACYVCDRKNDVIVFVTTGYHLEAIKLLLKKFYNLSFFNVDNKDEIQRILSENFIIYNAWVHENDNHAEGLAKHFTEQLV